MMKINMSAPVAFGHISFSQAGKRFNREWIFRQFNYDFYPRKRYAITGPNGSGKSTLLQAIAGSMQLSEGQVQWKGVSDSPIDPEQVYQSLAIAAPYLELIEEMTAKEMLEFHSQFKPLIPSVNIDDIISIIGLEKAAGKQIRNFSSGMKQRVKLAQAPRRTHQRPRPGSAQRHAAAGRAHRQ